jgi:hypothetical protein
MAVRGTPSDMMVTRPAAAKAADGNPVKASNSQQAPATDPATNAINLRPRTIMSSKPSALRFFLPGKICAREHQA